MVLTSRCTKSDYSGGFRQKSSGYWYRPSITAPLTNDIYKLNVRFFKETNDIGRFE